MKLSAKLYLLITFVVVAFAVVAGFVGFSWIQTRGLNELQRQALLVARNAYAMSERQVNLVNATDPLKNSLDQWNRAVTAFDESLAELTEHSMISYTGERMQNLLVHTEDMWTHSQGTVSEAQDTLAALAADEEVPSWHKKGIQPMLDEEETRERLSAEQTEALVDARRSLQSFQIVTRDTLVQNLDRVVHGIDAQATAVEQRTVLMSAVVIAVVIVVVMLAMVRFSRGLTRRINSLEAMMARMADLDFAGDIEDRSRDEVGALCRHTSAVLKTIREFMRVVRSASDQVAQLQGTLAEGSQHSAGALDQIDRTIRSLQQQFGTLDETLGSSATAIKEISDRIADLDGSIETQSSAVEEASASIEEFNSSIENVAKLSAERRARAEELAGLTAQAGERVASTNDVITGVGEKVDDILEITAIINNISEQTDLLSMNAAIESAHAGEAGKGFAVVAEEIRKLAESTSENAARIDDALRWITSRIREARDSSDESRKTVEQITGDIRSFSDAMAEISQSMDELRTGSREIMESSSEIRHTTTAVKEGSQSIREASDNIRGAMEEVTGVSERVRTGLEEIANGSSWILNSMNEIRDVSAQSREEMARLDQLVASFRTETEEDADTGPEEAHLESIPTDDEESSEQPAEEGPEQAGVTRAEQEDIEQARREE
ncbi:MAG: methyl-accepting chemotaxis protein [Spirochaetaceae bacterium]